MVFGVLLVFMMKNQMYDVWNNEDIDVHGWWIASNNIHVCKGASSCNCPGLKDHDDESIVLLQQMLQATVL
jgi:hypothetical protein